MDVVGGERGEGRAEWLKGCPMGAGLSVPAHLSQPLLLTSVRSSACSAN